MRMQSSTGTATATDRKRAQDLLTCSVCLQYFDDPRLLPCKHTFCRKCLERHQRRQPSSDRHQANLLPCPLAPSCLHVAVVPTRGVSGFPVDDRIPKLKERVVLQMAEDISRRIHGSGTGSGSSDSASVLSDQTDVTVETTCSAPAGNGYDSGDENTLPSDGYRQTAADSNSQSQSHSKFTRYFDKLDNEPDASDPSSSSSAGYKREPRRERRRVGYSTSFHLRRRRAEVSSPLAFDDAVPSTMEFLRRQPSRSGSAPHLDEEDVSHGGRLRTEKTVRGVHLREPLRRNANVFQSQHVSAERVRPTSAILEEVLLNAEQSSSSKSDTPSYRSFRCEDSSQPETKENYLGEPNRNGARRSSDTPTTSSSSSASAGSKPHADFHHIGTSARTERSNSGDRPRFNSSSTRRSRYSRDSQKPSDDSATMSSTSTTTTTTTAAAATSCDGTESQRDPIITARSRRKLPDEPLSSRREGFSARFASRGSTADNVTSSNYRQSNSSRGTAPTESQSTPRYFSSDLASEGASDHVMSSNCKRYNSTRGTAPTESQSTPRYFSSDLASENASDHVTPSNCKRYNSPRGTAPTDPQFTPRYFSSDLASEDVSDHVTSSNCKRYNSSCGTAPTDSQFTPRYFTTDLSSDHVTSSADNGTPFSYNHYNSSRDSAPAETPGQPFTSTPRHSPSVDIVVEDPQRFQPPSAAGDRLRPADTSHVFHTSSSFSDFMADRNQTGVNKSETISPPEMKSHRRSPLLDQSFGETPRLGRASTTSPLPRQRRDVATDDGIGVGHTPVMGRRTYSRRVVRISTPVDEVNGRNSPLPSNGVQRNGSSRFSSASEGRAGMSSWNGSGGAGINPESWWNSMSKYLDVSSDDDDDDDNDGESGTKAESDATKHADENGENDQPTSTDAAAAAVDGENGTIPADSLLAQTCGDGSKATSADNEAITVELNQQTASPSTEAPPGVDNDDISSEPSSSKRNKQNPVFLIAGLKPVIIKSSTPISFVPIATTHVGFKRHSTGSTAGSAADLAAPLQANGDCTSATASADDVQPLSDPAAISSAAQNDQTVEACGEPVTADDVVPPCPPRREMTEFDRILQAARLKYSSYEPPETVPKKPTLMTSCSDGITCNWRTQRDDFATPTSLAILADGSVFVADWSNSSIDCYDGDGSLLHSVTGTKPYGIACLVSGDAERIYVGDRRSKTVRIFDAFGCDVAQWDVEKTSFGWISGIAALRNGNLVIVDRERCKVGVFNAGGDRLLEFGAYGTNDKQLCMADFVGVDSHDRVIIADSGNHCLKLFDANAGGKPIGRWSQRGSEDGCLDWPKGVVVDRNDNVIVADTNNNRVCQFADSGQFVGHLVTGIVKPYSVALSAAGNLLGVTQFSLSGFSQVNIYSLGNNENREQLTGERVIG